MREHITRRVSPECFFQQLNLHQKNMHTSTNPESPRPPIRRFRHEQGKHNTRVNLVRQCSPHVSAKTARHWRGHVQHARMLFPRSSTVAWPRSCMRPSGRASPNSPKPSCRPVQVSILLHCQRGHAWRYLCNHLLRRWATPRLCWCPDSWCCMCVYCFFSPVGMCLSCLVSWQKNVLKTAPNSKLQRLLPDFTPAIVEHWKTNLTTLLARCDLQDKRSRSTKSCQLTIDCILLLVFTLQPYFPFSSRKKKECCSLSPTFIPNLIFFHFVVVFLTTRKFGCILGILKCCFVVCSVVLV